MDSPHWVENELWAPITAVSATHGGRASGLICATAVASTLNAEPPRVVLQLRKDNLTHELALASGRFTLHLLRRDQQRLFRFLALGEGPPDEPTLATAACRVLATMDAVDSTVILAEVTSSERLPGDAFTGDDIVWDDELRAV